MTQIVPIKIDNFDDGLNTKTPVVNIKTSEASEVLNLRGSGGALYPRRDKLLFSTLPNSNPVHSLAIWKQDDGDKFLIAGCQNKIYRKLLVGTSQLWWNTSWNNRREIIVNNTTPYSYTNTLLEVVLPVGFDYTGFNTNGEDIRFLIYENNVFMELDYYIAEWNKANNTKESIIYVVVPSFSAVSTKSIYLYYNNPTATAKSNSNIGEFDFYKDGYPFFVKWNGEFYNLVVISGYDIGIYSSYSWGYYGFQNFKDSQKVRVKVTHNCQHLYPTQQGICIKLDDNFTNYGNIVFLGMVYYPPDFEFRGLSCRYASTNIMYGGGKDTTNPYNWTTNVNYSFELLIEKAEGKITGTIKDATGTVILNKVLTGLTISSINLATLWEWAGGYGVQVDYQQWAKIYNLLPVTYSIGTPQSSTGGTDWVEEINANLTSASSWNWEIVKNKFIICNGVDTPRVWDGINWVSWSATQGLNEAVKYITVHKNRLFVARTPTNKSRLFYSNVSDTGEPLFEIPDNWKTNTIINYEDIEVGDGGEITGLIPNVFDSLFIVKDIKLKLLQGNTPADWEEKGLPHPFGFVAPKTIVKQEDIIFGLSHLGLHYISGAIGNIEAFTFDNIKANSLTEKIEPTLLGGEDGSGNILSALTLSSAFGIVYDNKYYLFFPDNNISLVLDWRRKSWWLDNDVVLSGIVDRDTNIFYGGSKAADGKIYQYEAVNKILTNRWRGGRILFGLQSRIREFMINLKGSCEIKIITDKASFNKIINSNKVHPISIKGKQMEIEIINITDQIYSMVVSVIPLRQN